MKPLEGPQQFEAVVIGGSAGAVDAFKVILSALPESYELPVILIIHLPDGATTLLPEIVNHYSKIPAFEAIDQEEVKAGKIYIAPPDYHLLINPDQSFSLSFEEPLNFSRPSIDILFETAADTFRDRLVAILLTGANEDGVNGLKNIQRQGGYVIVQDPETAVARTMPESAIKALKPDQVLNLSEIGTFLSGLKRSN